MKMTEFRIIKRVATRTLTALMIQQELRDYNIDLGYTYIANICERLHKTGLLSRHPLGHQVFWKATVMGLQECDVFKATIGVQTDSSSINLVWPLGRFVKA